MKAKLASLALILLMVTGCTDWERTTFQSLAASQAVINEAQADYETGCTIDVHPQGCIPHNATAYKAINEAKALQVTAVQSMESYETIKAAKGSKDALQAQEAIVAASLLQIAPLIASVKGLYTTTGGGK